MQCPFCLEKNAAGAKFCSNCGSPLHLRICSKCQAINDKTARSCTECGSPLPEFQEQPEVNTAAEDFSVNKNDSSTQLVAEMKNFHELLASPEKEVSKQLFEVERMSPE